MLRACLFLIVLLSAAPADAAGFQYGSAPDGDGKPLELAIWYPSEGAVSTQAFGLFTQDVAFYGPVAGKQLPLIVISHGTGGSAASHYDTALALAEAGFVVVAPTHAGDNYKDQSTAFTPHNFTDRPRQVSRVIDFMLKSWGGHANIDPGRIGMLGHSAGGTTALIDLGGEPDLARAVKFCRDQAEFWGCIQAKQAAGAGAAWSGMKTPRWPHDDRVKAAAIAAPALGFAFTKEGLAAVTAPLQLWRAENDEVAPNQWFADPIKDALPKPPDDQFVPKAGHFDFLAPCNDALAKLAPDICRSAEGFDRAAFHQEFNKALAEFFKAKLASP
ncbi:MAG: dienelactone hydrolase family protein [Alphaproteobacteria bacterium]|nr:dienelactone hydrolase family protein [Alphaproteobacteria bacterium]